MRRYEFGASDDVCFDCRDKLAVGEVTAGAPDRTARLRQLAPLIQAGQLHIHKNGYTSVAAAAAAGEEGDISLG